VWPQNEDSYKNLIKKTICELSDVFDYPDLSENQKNLSQN